MRDWLQQHLNLSLDQQARLLRTLVIVLGLWITHRLVLAVVYRRTTDPWSRYRWRKTLGYLFVAVSPIPRCATSATKSKGSPARSPRRNHPA